MRKGKIFPAATDNNFSCDAAGQKERNPHNMEIWEILLLIVGVWAAFEIVFSAIVFFAAFRRGKKRGVEGTGEAYMLFEPLYREEKQYADGLEKREVSVTARDGTTLKGDFYPAPNARATLLYFHGYRGTSADFCFCIRFFHSRGFNVLLPDQRAHGRSGGKYICFGVKERFDCLDWIKFAGETLAQGLPVVLDGISMGCTTVLLATELDLPDQVKAVVADCGFTSAWEQIKHTIKTNMRLPAFPSLYLVSLFARIFAGIRLRGCDTRKAMEKNTTVPVFFATGTRDRVVPPEMTKQNYEACRAPKMLLLTEAAHGMSYLAAKAEYEKQLEDFLEGCLKQID